MQKNMEVTEKNNLVLFNNPFMSQIVFNVCKLFTNNYEGEIHDEIKSVVKDKNAQLDAYIDIAIYSIGTLYILSVANPELDYGYLVSSLTKRLKMPNKNPFSSPFIRVPEWNKERGLDKVPFRLSLQTGFIIEEFFEFFEVDDYRNKAVKYSHRFSDENKHPMTIYDTFASILTNALLAIGSYSENETFGQFIFDKMTIVMDANDKKGSKRDNEGKIGKDSSFIEPELGI